ncbi:tyrosine-type recombinase/integrase [Natronomonas gomsonensis]|uniref:tyrosine-type recombinase/integrase n=1 Tax=Natronomonas gomsonensis TaxID=1046043 RepID=UPI0020CA7F23|nr:tyrosine-type recombinase/integrase [Natronomonas gomsonensis]MCY4730458.1 tyrosine-type recombinase/integrase [Natronomonas gomsonensis]
MPREKKHEVLLDADVWDHKVFKNKHDCINQWLRRKDSTGASRRTLNSYSRTAAKFFHEHFPDTHPSDVVVGDIEQYVLIIDKRDVADNTKRRYVESLSSFYDWAMKRPRFDDITGNPAGVVLEELGRVRRERPDTATWEKGRSIIQNISDPRDKTAAVLMAKTGARTDEVLSLKEDDLMLEDGFVRFRDRKGGSNTVNPIDEETVQALTRLMAISSDDSDYLFTSIRGGRIDRERIRRSVRRAAVQAEVMEEEDEKRWHHKFVPHYYRTIFTSLMRNNGMPDHYTRYLRGDGDQEVMDLYTKIPRDEVREEYLKHIKPLNLYARTDGGGENHESVNTKSKLRQTKLDRL